MKKLCFLMLFLSVGLFANDTYYETFRNYMKSQNSLYSELEIKNMYDMLGGDEFMKKVEEESKIQNQKQYLKVNDNEKQK